MDEPYIFSFLDIVIDENIIINYSENQFFNSTWNINDSGYNNISINNINVIAAVFNDKSHVEHSYPPNDNPFDAYYIDATLLNIPNSTNRNYQNHNYTHNVFCELGTLSGCQACPDVLKILNKIYESNKLPFYFITLISDKNNYSYNRLLKDYNIALYPTCFFDGGYQVISGNYYNETFFENLINECANRDVHDLNMTITTKWIGNEYLNKLRINVSIHNNEKIENIEPQPPKIEGPNSGLIKENYTYRIVTEDPNGDELYYIIDWGDNSEEMTTDIIPSKVPVLVNHQWIEKAVARPGSCGGVCRASRSSGSSPHHFSR